MLPIHQGGGLSGRPLHARALALVRALRRGLGATFPIVGVGGIMDAASAHRNARSRRGPVQVYTGFVYNGHTLLTEILRIARRVRAAGARMAPEISTAAVDALLPQTQCTRCGYQGCRPTPRR